MIVKVRVVQEATVTVDYDGRRTSKEELHQLFEQGVLRANNGFVFTGDNKGFTTTVVASDTTQVEVLS